MLENTQEKVIDNDCLRKICDNCKVPKNLSFKANANIKNLELKVKMLGTKYTEIVEGIYVVEDDNNIRIISNEDIYIVPMLMFKKTTFKNIEFGNVKICQSSTSMSEMFVECKADSVDLFGLDTSNIDDMREMFYASDIGVIKLTGINTTNTTKMGGMFNHCTSNIIDLDTLTIDNVSNISDMFYCTKVKKLDLSNFRFDKVTCAISMFEDCNIEEVIMPNVNFRRNTNISYMFYMSHINTLNIDRFNLDILIYNARNIKNFLYKNAIGIIVLTNTDLSDKQYYELQDITDRIILDLGNPELSIILLSDTSEKLYEILTDSIELSEMNEKGGSALVLRIQEYNACIGSEK